LRAQVLQWMFFEQPCHLHCGGAVLDSFAQQEVGEVGRGRYVAGAGNLALAIMDRHLQRQEFLVAYTHVAADG
jgi:hypothetical protein